MKTHDEVCKFFRFRGTRDNLPWCSPKGTRGTLADMLGQIGFNRGVEVGTRKGDYAKILCEKNPNLELTCVDPWAAYGRLRQDTQDAIYHEAVRNLAPYKAFLLRKPSLDAVREFTPRSIDFVYIDGAHDFDNAVSDIIAWSPVVKSGGIVAVHDYYSFYQAGVVQAVDSYTHCHCINPWYVTKERLPTAFWVNP